MNTERQHGTNETQQTSRVRALVSFLGLSFVQGAVGLLLLPLYVSRIPPAEYGVLAAVMIVAGVVGVVANLKLDSAMRTYYFDYRAEPELLRSYLRQVFSLSVCAASVVFAFMLAIGKPLFALLFVHNEVAFHPAGSIAVAGACLNACLSPYFVYLRNRLLLRELIAWQSFILVGTIALQSVFLIALDAGIYGVLWGSTLPLALAVTWLCVARPDLLTCRFDWQSLKPSLKYSTPLVVLGLVYLLGTRMDRLVLERHVELESLGAYAVLIGVLGILGIVLGVVENTIRPYLYSEMKADRDHAGLFAIYLRLYILGGSLGLSFAVLLGSSLHVVTMNSVYLSIREWMVPGATALIPTIFIQYYSMFFDFHKRSVALTAGIVVRFVVLCLLLIVLVPEYSIAGALWAVFLSGALNAIVFGVAARRMFAIAAPWPVIVTQLGVFVAVSWTLSSLVGRFEVFGVLQFVMLTGLLLVLNWRQLRVFLAEERFSTTSSEASRGEEAQP